MEEKRWRNKKWKQDEVEVCSLEEAQVARDFIAEEQNSGILFMPNLGMHFINIITEFCVLYMDLLGLEIYSNNCGPTIYSI